MRQVMAASEALARLELPVARGIPDEAVPLVHPVRGGHPFGGAEHHPLLPRLRRPPEAFAHQGRPDAGALGRRVDGLIMVGSRTDPRPSLGRELPVPEGLEGDHLAVTGPTIEALRPLPPADLVATPKRDSYLPRVLKPGGIACISTNNLSSWHNIWSLVFGYQPFPMHVSDALIVGNPLNPEHGQPHEDAGRIHVRVFTGRALGRDRPMTSTTHPPARWRNPCAFSFALPAGFVGRRGHIAVPARPVIVPLPRPITTAVGTIPSAPAAARRVRTAFARARGCAPSPRRG